MLPRNTHAILEPRAGATRFTLARRDPSPALARFVERYWIVRWDLRDAEPYAQETLPFPCVNLVFGTHRPGLFGVPDERFVARLDGAGWVVGVKFRPGGFRPFWPDEIASLTDRELAIGAAFGDRGVAIDRAVHDAPDDDLRLARIEAFLAAVAPAPDPRIDDVARAVELAQAEPALARVDELAARAAIPVRTLERLFRAYVGVSPKWVIRRFRVHEAAARAGDGAALDWAALAHELGYFDQAHFIRDFKAQVGRTPAEYADACSR